MTATPRPGLRDVSPYISPQLTVTARLNTNECPVPLPQAFADELADEIASLPLNRYPDGQMTRLREELATSVEPHCLYCGGTLPGDRPIRFCPHCGQRQAPPECPQCHSDVEPAWRHCVNCGAALGER